MSSIRQRKKQSGVAQSNLHPQKQRDERKPSPAFESHAKHETESDDDESEKQGYGYAPSDDDAAGESADDSADSNDEDEASDDDAKDDGGSPPTGLELRGVEAFELDSASSDDTVLLASAILGFLSFLCCCIILPLYGVKEEHIMATSMVCMLGFVLFSSLCFGRGRASNAESIGSLSRSSALDSDSVTPGQVFFVAGCVGGLLGGLFGGVLKNSYGYTGGFPGSSGSVWQ